MAKRTTSGGGITSNKLVQKREATREKPKTRSVNPGGADAQGQQFAGRITPLYGGPNFQPVKLGNQLATNIGKGGPGTGRTTLARGTQGTHGAPAQGSTPPARDILSEFGPERSKG